MLAMQYGFGLPESFDMIAIRRRVAEKGPVFDRLTGLASKAFLCTDTSGRCLVPSVANQYAAFYLWRSPVAAADFLTGPLFEAVVAAFGRPAVRVMPVLLTGEGDTSRPPLVAVHETVGIAPDLRSGELRRRETALHTESLRRGGVYARTAALDAERWEVVRFTLYHGAAALPEPSGAAYEVLHLSVPMGD